MAALDPNVRNLDVLANELNNGNPNGIVCVSAFRGDGLVVSYTDGGTVTFTSALPPPANGGAVCNNGQGQVSCYFPL